MENVSLTGIGRNHQLGSEIECDWPAYGLPAAIHRRSGSEAALLERVKPLFRVVLGAKSAVRFDSSEIRGLVLNRKVLAESMTCCSGRLPGNYSTRLHI
jgi:hypothetical protein